MSNDELRQGGGEFSDQTGTQEYIRQFGQENSLAEREKKAAEDYYFSQNEQGTGTTGFNSKEATDIDRRKPVDNGLSSAFTNNTGADLFSLTDDDEDKQSDADADADDLVTEPEEDEDWAEDWDDRDGELEAETEEEDEDEEEAAGEAEAEDELAGEVEGGGGAADAAADDGKRKKLKWQNGEPITLQLWEACKADDKFWETLPAINLALMGVLVADPNAPKLGVLFYKNWQSVNGAGDDLVAAMLNIGASQGTRLALTACSALGAMFSQQWGATANMATFYKYAQEKFNEVPLIADAIKQAIQRLNKPQKKKK